LRKQVLPIDAISLEMTNYGQRFKISGKLIGPNGVSLLVCTIWMIETETGKCKFITMFPERME